MHHVCALFNGRRNIGDQVGFVCPFCLEKKQEKVRAEGSKEVVVAPLEANKKMAAQDLQESILTTFLEGRIQQRLERAYQETADKYGIALEAVEKCPTLSLRLVSAYEKMHVVRDGVQGRYKHKNYPTEFPCRTKCLVLFQKIDGQDVILFGMYVYEYGHKCPNPNQRRVYISYLDSVHYFRPKQYRTVVYHEIIISYLEYVKARGFHTAHIWACPPLKGDDYILYVHPQDQKTPKDDKLRKWYQDLLAVCTDRGIVTEMSDIFAEYLADHSLDATVLPYFEGDYWVNEAEVIIKDLRVDDGEPGAGVEDEDETDDVPSKSKNKSKRKGQAARPTRASRGGGATGPAGKSERDPVMAKLASIIEPMKEAFFVARLWPKEYADACVASRLEEIAPEATKKAEQESKMLQEEGLMTSSSSSGAIASKMGGDSSSQGASMVVVGEVAVTADVDTALAVKIKDESKSDGGDTTEEADASAVKMEVVDEKVEEKKVEPEEVKEKEKEKEEVEVEEETKAATETTTPARNSRKNTTAQPARKSTRGRSAETPEKAEKEAAAVAAGGVEIKEEPASSSSSKSKATTDQSKQEPTKSEPEANQAKEAATAMAVVVDPPVKEEEKEGETAAAAAAAVVAVKSETKEDAAAAGSTVDTKMDVVEGADASSSSSSSSSSSAAVETTAEISAAAAAAAEDNAPPAAKPTMLPLLFSKEDVFELNPPGTMKHEIMTGWLTYSSLTHPTQTPLIVT